MQQEFAVVTPTTTLATAARQMSDLGVTMLPVCEGRTLVGVLTARDLTVRATAEGCNPHTTRVRDLMTRAVIYVCDDEDVQRADLLLRRYRLTGLPVLNHKGELVGMVSNRELKNATNHN